MSAGSVRIAVLSCVVLFPAAGCVGDGGDSTEQREIERLRALPYAEMAPARPGDDIRDGVVLRDAGRSDPGLNLYTVQMRSEAHLIDETGATLRSWRHRPSARWERAELLPGGDLLVVGADVPPTPVEGIPDDTRYLLRLGWDGEVRWKRYLPVHHDVEQRRDGRLLALTFKRRRLPVIHPEVATRDDTLTLLDPRGEVLEELSLLDTMSKRADLFPLDMVRPNSLGVVPWFDLFHANSIEWIERPDLSGRHPIYETGNVLVCLRHQNRIAVLNWPRREVVWAWGRGELLGPHDARLLSDGNVLIFDNGMGRGWSRVLELDPAASTIVWEYRADPPEAFYTLSKGSSQRLSNGNTLIAESDRGRAFEVTPGGEIVWEFLAPERGPGGARAAIVRMVRYKREFLGRSPLEAP